MTDEHIQSVVLALNVSEVLLRDTPDVYQKMEDVALDAIYQAAKKRQLGMGQIARLFHKDISEVERLISNARKRSEETSSVHEFRN
jgi:hypothetical protein